MEIDNVKYRETILRKANITEKELQEKISGKISELKGLISEEGAILLVANEYGINQNEFIIGTKDSVQEEIDFDTKEQKKSGSSVEGREEIGLDGLGGKFVKHPRVGEQIEFTLSKVFKNTNQKELTAVNPADGKRFSLALPGTNPEFKVDYITDLDEVYSPKAWEVVNRIQDIRKKLQKTEGLRLRVKHIKDGMKIRDNTPSYEVSVLIDKSWKTINPKTRDFD